MGDFFAVIQPTDGYQHAENIQGHNTDISWHSLPAQSRTLFIMKNTHPHKHVTYYLQEELRGQFNRIFPRSFLPAIIKAPPVYLLTGGLSFRVSFQGSVCQ
jgi:hypothetical protein